MAKMMKLGWESDEANAKLVVSEVEVPSGEIAFKTFSEFPWVEIVRAKGLKAWHDKRADGARLVMVVDEEGLLKQNKVNAFASVLYGSHVHGNVIAGVAYIVVEHLATVDGEEDWQLRGIEPDDEVNVNLVQNYIAEAALFPASL